MNGDRIVSDCKSDGFGYGWCKSITGHNYLAIVAQWLVLQPSKLEMPVRFWSIAHLILAIGVKVAHQVLVLREGERYLHGQLIDLVTQLEEYYTYTLLFNEKQMNYER